MKRKISTLCITALSALPALAQDFPGYRSGNYTGVNSVYFNPANIADSRYRWDFNLFSLSTNVGNSNASFSLSNISETFNGDEISDQIFGKNAEKSSGFVSTDLHGPSFMFNTGKKMSFAVTTRARVMANVRDMDGKLIDKITQDFENDPSLPYTISSNSNMHFNVNAWTEYGVSAARVIKDDGKHFFKAGLTLKYLAGAGNAFVNISNLNGTINDDQLQASAYLSNTTGRLAMGFGGITINDLEVSEITKMESRGFGTSIGFVYEYRPEYEKYQRDSARGWQKNMNKYKWKIGFALNDLGRIKYDKDMQRSGAYDIDITGNERLYLDDLADVDIDDYKTFFNNRPQFFTPDNSNSESISKVSLPSTLQIDIDYHLHRGFYVSLASQFSLINSSNKPYNSSYYSSFNLTPRYEGRGMGFYLPLSYNGLTKVNAGASFSFGPLFIGSGSVLTALFGNSKQADVHIGLRIGGLQKNLEKRELKEQKKELRRAEKAREEEEKANAEKLNAEKQTENTNPQPN